MTVMAGSGCGDALLPADYAGPPALAVGGSVVRNGDGLYQEAQSPRLSLVWLTDRGANTNMRSLIAQPVAFQRSQQLQKDWDIGISAPLELAKMQLNVGSSNPRMAIGQLVYFDDRDGDGQFAWNCAGPRCDQIKAISREFVVYLDQPLTCQSQIPMGGETKTHLLGSGFHYFAWSGATLEERPISGDLQFILKEAAPNWSDSLKALEEFAQQLTRAYKLNALGGC